VSLAESGFRVWLLGEEGRSLGIGGGEGSGDMVLVEIKRVEGSYGGITCRGSWVGM
jgi:hypothetical protein